MKKLFAAISAAVLLVGCTRDVKVTVVNESAVSLTNVLVTGSGFSTSIGSVAPGATQQVSLRSDTGDFKLEFDADGKHFTEASPANPWKGVKEHIMTVTTNLSVSDVFVTSF